MRCSAIFLVLLFGFAAPPASGCDNLRLEQVPSLIDFTGNLSPSLTFRVQRDGSDGCDFYVACSNNGGGNSGAYTSRSLRRSSGGDTIPAQLCLDAACTIHCKRRGEASGTEVISGSFPSGNAAPAFQAFTIYPRLGTLDYPRWGSYDRDFSLRVYLGAFNSNDEEDEDPFNLQYTVSKAIDLSLVDTGGTFNLAATSKTMNFGTLTTGEQQLVDLVLKYNAGYRVRVRTTYGGNLRRQGGSGTHNVAYSMTVNNTPATLSTSYQTVLTGSGTSVAGGLRLPVRVTVGTVAANQAPGSYQDEITFLVETTE